MGQRSEEPVQNATHRTQDASASCLVSAPDRILGTHTLRLSAGSLMCAGPTGHAAVTKGCGSANVQIGTTHPSMSYRCRNCRKFFSVKTGTVMHRSKLGCQTWAIAIYLLNTGIKGVSSMKLHRDLGVSQPTAWHLAHRIRETWT